MVVLQKLERIQSQNNRELRPLQPPVPLPAARQAERVNDEPVKVLDLLLFLYFIWKWGETFEKLHFSTFSPKKWFYLTYSAGEYFEKLALKKTENATLNCFISKARANSESKLTFSESSFNFLQNKVAFCTLFTRVHDRGLRPRCRCQWLVVLKELNYSLCCFWVSGYNNFNYKY